MRISFVWILILLIPFAGIAQPKAKKEKKPLETALNTPARRAKNVILLIGDGMGLTQISSGLYNNNNALSLERFPFTGLQKTHASDDLITDSAAAGTAIACGVKTKVGAIGVGKDNKPARSLMEEAEAKGMATGMVVTSSLVDATPSAFVAHVPSRDQKEDIAKSYLNIDIDFLVGGGKEYFTQRKSDDRDLARELQEKGYVVSDYTESEIPKVTLDLKKNFAFFTAEEDPGKFQESRSYLLPASRLGAVFLKGHNDKGFFLMVEGSQIDWGGHANDASYVVAEFLEFDRVIGSLLEFAMEDGETLVIVTADHETGGLAINPGSQMNNLLTEFNTNSHTGIMVPVFAYGPGAELFSGIYDNTEINRRIKKALGWE
ncbi:MAG: alkaline phosphatase [Haliscomenobacter sp.]|mgnify:CR=1 FL=1|nr:alkaline phosphatase [Haliscomenobacter sp.]MBK8653958.1 alkaline phosphatase [Haliscomenobacter sp.]MBP9075850.1 alkaline phosphatase [Haliscomenobacter sp.]MBP9872491.1 alkaline phosphatase [Haliscomenobacter sp.]